MLIEKALKALQSSERQVLKGNAGRGSLALGVLSELPRGWSNEGPLEGQGSNLIALRFGSPGRLGDFWLLPNQLNEELEVDLVGHAVPIRRDSRETSTKLRSALPPNDSVGRGH
jgi:hypothetical protein